jgi:hypothetical protein
VEVAARARARARLGGLAGARARAALVAVIGLSGCRGDARDKIRPVDETRTSTPPCATTCGGKCVDLQRDPANCGRCGTSCGAAGACALGLCAHSVDWAETLRGYDVAASYEADAATTGGTAGTRAARYAFVCPRQRTVPRVWGSDLYTSDSSLCGAAAHAGVIATTGGAFVVERRAGASSYDGSTRFGVTTTTWSAFDESFVVLGDGCIPAATRCGGACVDLTGDARHCGACGHACGAGRTCLAGGCVEGEVASKETSASGRLCTAGAEHSFHCPPTATAGATVWGTDVYTVDSSVCVAAVHAGKIPASGGRVTITMRPGLKSYAASTRHGVTSEAWGAWPCSFEVDRATPGP